MNPYLVSAVAVGVTLNNTWGRRRPKPPPPGGFANVASRRIHYVERSGEGPPVVLLHGMPGTHQDFAGVVAALPRRHTVAVDRPGYGWSEGGPLDYQAQIDLVAELITALGLERAVLAGHSFGGLLALGIAARHPQIVAGLALIAPSGGGLRSGPFRMGAARMVRVMGASGIRPIADITVGGLVRRVGAAIDTRFAFAPDPVDGEYAERLHFLTLHDDNLSAMANDRLAYSRNIAWIDERIPSLDVPAVVLLARGDRPIPIHHGRQLASALPGATVVEVDGGHMLPVVQPDSVAAAVSSIGYHHPAAATTNRTQPNTKDSQ
jgi:pimeloyl-ACP methyl ester carboxylesterase